ncbi:hypothetical protein [Pseudogemmobacter faecipullorum]|uniref:Uncharacterized protein n=1 Tax=Pseudogemmobacter faecipullorum TaxID=2755041 RepID=A0ABS8CQZ8_9RHOB|nr:hypothetical protein [Pseudogemmobacter faecipullorum]MCB5411798.1 hypothetical protein [Pseudogemmobacter faecipullorum]
MSEQLSMLDLWEPKPEPVVYVPRPRRTVLTRAYGEAAYSMEIYEDSPDPVEIEIRGIPCLIVSAFGASTYTVQPPGSLFWSCTGFRSMATGGASVDEVIQLVEEHIDAPAAKSGLGGKLERWWPSYVTQWQQSLAYHGFADRSREHWGWCAREVGQAAIWADYDARQAEALARMISEGIDPNDVGPPSGFKGKWPRFSMDEHK